MFLLDKIDHFFRVEQATTPLRWHTIDVDTPGLYGLMKHPDGRFCRMPKETADAVAIENPDSPVPGLFTNTSGGRLRLITDSSVVAVRVRLGNSRDFSSRITYLGAAGMDIYQKEDDVWIFSGCLAPENLSVDDHNDHIKLYEAALSFGVSRRRELLIHFPLYTDVFSVELGVDEGAAIELAPEYSGKKVVFYGSSITQGASAPKPGMNYPAILSRELDFDFVNLGFSGGARAEKAILEYLCGLQMSVLVFDYDHNAPTPEYLRKTHLNAYQTIRERRPELPIVLASAPFAHLDAEYSERREIILETYHYALEHCDQRIAFVDGAKMFSEEFMEECTVDGIHPSGLGMVYMAKAFRPALQKMLLMSE